MTASLLREARRVVRDRMRGNRPTQTRGDSGPNAVLAACAVLRISATDAALELLPYAYGYGLAVNGLPPDTAGLCGQHADALLDGYLVGLWEDPAVAFPAAVSVHESAYGGKLIP